MTLPDGVTWYHLLTETADELSARGVSAANVVSLRIAHTGSSKHWSRRWASTVGSWGYVRPRAEIAELADVEEAEVLVKAKSVGVKYATATKSRAQAEVALRAYVGRDHSDAEVRRALGVLEVERIQYCARIQWLLDAYAIDIDELLGLDVGVFLSLWAENGLELVPPTSSRTSLGPEELRRLLAAINV